MIKQSKLRFFEISLIAVLLSACGGQDAAQTTTKVNADTASKLTNLETQSAQSVQTVNQTQESLMGSVTGQSSVRIQSAQVNGNETIIQNFLGVSLPHTRTPVYGGKLPDTGITANHCFGAGSNTLISCNSPAAIALNPKQDGMVGRDVTSPSAADGRLGFSFSDVPKPGAGVYAKTECVKDNITGLVWEGKPVSGFRANTNTYTNFDSTIKLQKLVSVDTFYTDFVFGMPTQAEIDAPNNTIGYKTAVNASALCGFTDWRLPTADELQSLVNLGTAPLPAIDNDWFPNTQRAPYWSATPSSAYAKFAWFLTFWDGQLSFNDGDYYYNARYFFNAVRLVRGVTATPPTRYTYSNDGAEVLDLQTNLVWRRCSEGMIWSGLTCTGTPTSYSHENALIHTKSQTGWRLPNVKELSSIIERNANLPSVNNAVFPGTPLYDYWSASPFIAPDPALEGFAWYVNFSYGYANWAFRTYNLPAVRLVKDSP
jgi:Protein of unknown function (DUF1566)